MMKKITISIGAGFLIALPMMTFAQTGTTTVVHKAKVNIVCAQTAVEKRDTALITTVNAYNTAITKALTVRKDAVKAAFDLPTSKEIEAARRAANKTFAESTKTAAASVKTSRTATWATFATDMKACGIVNTEVPTVITSPSSL